MSDVTLSYVTSFLPDNMSGLKKSFIQVWGNHISVEEMNRRCWCLPLTNFYKFFRSSYGRLVWVEFEPTTTKPTELSGNYIHISISRTKYVARSIYVYIYYIIFYIYIHIYTHTILEQIRINRTTMSLLHNVSPLNLDR